MKDHYVAIVFVRMQDIPLDSCKKILDYFGSLLMLDECLELYDDFSSLVSNEDNLTANSVLEILRL